MLWKRAKYRVVCVCGETIIDVYRYKCNVRRNLHIIISTTRVVLECINHGTCPNHVPLLSKYCPREKYNVRPVFAQCNCFKSTTYEKRILTSNILVSTYYSDKKRSIRRCIHKLLKYASFVKYFSFCDEYGTYMNATSTYGQTFDFKYSKTLSLNTV